MLKYVYWVILSIVIGGNTTLIRKFISDGKRSQIRGPQPEGLNRFKYAHFVRGCKTYYSTYQNKEWICIALGAVSLILAMVLFVWSDVDLGAATGPLSIVLFLAVVVSMFTAIYVLYCHDWVKFKDGQVVFLAGCAGYLPIENMLNVEVGTKNKVIVHLTDGKKLVFFSMKQPQELATRLQQLIPTKNQSSAKHS